MFVRVDSISHILIIFVISSFTILFRCVVFFFSPSKKIHSGQYNEIDGGNCLACPVGQYQDDKGESNCKACSEDRYGVQLFDSNNQQRPAVSSTECMECPKSPDQTTGGIEGSTSIDACKCPHTEYYSSSSECLPCPEGADCSAHDGITLAELVALPGFW